MPGISKWLFSIAVAAAGGFLARTLGTNIQALGWSALLFVFAAAVTKYLERRGKQTPGGGGLVLAWVHSPFSRQSRIKRLQRQIGAVDTRLTERIRTEVKTLGFTEYSATGAIFGALIGSIAHARWYVAPPPGQGTPRTLLFGSSDSVTRVEAENPDEGDALEARTKFDAVVTVARSWPDYRERESLVSRLNRLKA